MILNYQKVDKHGINLEMENFPTSLHKVCSSTKTSDKNSQKNTLKSLTNSQCYLLQANCYEILSYNTVNACCR